MMIMSEDTYLGALTNQTVYAPVIEKLCDAGSIDEATVEELKKCFTAVDLAIPGGLLALTKVIMAQTQLDVNLQESYLRLQATAPTDDLMLPQADPAYRELSARAIALRRVLARIPDEMADRRTFLETIKEIASSIKKLLDATNTIHQVVPVGVQAPVERRKKEFVHYSKRFSNTLKEYFKGEQAAQVFVSANQLIYQTSQIVRTVADESNKAATLS